MNLSALADKGGLMAIFSSRKRENPVELVTESGPPVMAEVVLPALKREEPVVNPTDLSKELFQKAEKLLGYLPQQRSQDAVAKAFAQVGITPLDASSVQAYQRAAALKVFRTLSEDQKRYVRVDWLNTSLPNYKKPIPEFVLSHAIALKELLPEATFFVEELHAFQDPFLAFYYGNQRYYVDVWDEPDFEGRQTI